MRYILNYTLITGVLFFSSCTTEEQDTASGEMSKKFHADKCVIAKEKSSTTSGEALQVVKVKMVNMKDYSDLELRRRGSIVAQGYLQYLSPEEQGQFKVIEIEFAKEGEESDGHDNPVFGMNQVRTADSVFKVLNEVFKKRASGGFMASRELIDTSYIPDSSLVSLDDLIRPDDAKYGAISQTDFGGFFITELADAEERVYVIWVIARRDSGTDDYRFIYSPLRKKFVAIAVNEE